MLFCDKTSDVQAVRKIENLLEKARKHRYLHRAAEDIESYLLERVVRESDVKFARAHLEEAEKKFMTNSNRNPFLEAVKRKIIDTRISGRWERPQPEPYKEKRKFRRDRFGQKVLIEQEKEKTSSLLCCKRERFNKIIMGLKSEQIWKRRHALKRTPSFRGYDAPRAHEKSRASSAPRAQESYEAPRAEEASEAEDAPSAPKAHPTNTPLRSPTPFEIENEHALNKIRFQIKPEGGPTTYIDFQAIRAPRATENHQDVGAPRAPKIFKFNLHYNDVDCWIEQYEETKEPAEQDPEDVVPEEPEDVALEAVVENAEDLPEDVPEGDGDLDSNSEGSSED